ncbi:MAG: MBL fold metallo-hydrolase [Ignavibacteria bacterium]|nr:MBL fold metallo-hydrolase [Ignavibacteria bacterium]
MKIARFAVNPFSMNCYIYYDEDTRDAVIIDPGAFTEEEKNTIVSFVNDNSLNVSSIINTHGHVDHILGNGFAKDTFRKKIFMNKDDQFLLESSREQARFFGLEIEEPPEVDESLEEGSDIIVGNASLRVIKTPGHSPGSVCLIDDKNRNVFCGDLIFHNSVGRTDLPGGNFKVLISSVRDKLFESCKDDYALFPGHMEDTTIGHEKTYNPFLIG